MQPSAHLKPTPADSWLWDVFCRVIDNHGDLGVLLRLSRQLADSGHRVRLWVDDATALAWMAPDPIPGVQVHPWSESEQPEHLKRLEMAQVWVEGFGCEISASFIANYSMNNCDESRKSVIKPVWLNLEYLTAESYAERCHGLPSPVMSGPGQGWTKFFFYPGFTPKTGGLLREAALADQRAAFDRAAWLSGQGIDWRGEKLVSLFCYEPLPLRSFLQSCAGGDTPIRLLVTHGRPAAAVRALWPELTGTPGRIAPVTPPLSNSVWQRGALTIQFLPPLSQLDFDHLLWACDWNFVRGEDSLVRAIWAGQPFVWHIYPQEDGAHHAKLQAFLSCLEAPASVRAWHQWWNQDAHLAPAAAAAPNLQDPSPHWLPEQDLAWFPSCRAALAKQPDLATQLIKEVLARMDAPAA